MVSLRDRGWQLFDAIVAEAPMRDANPWNRVQGQLAYVPDYATLERLLGKLGREDDAYHAVALALPDLRPETEAPGVPEDDAAGPLPAGAVDGTPASDNRSQSVLEERLQDRLLRVSPAALPSVALRRDRVPAELDPARFFRVMCDRVLGNSPVNFHTEARRRREAPVVDTELLGP